MFCVLKGSIELETKRSHIPIISSEGCLFNGEEAQRNKD
jgi:hypothetical protein